MYTNILLRRKTIEVLKGMRCEVSFPSCRPHCGKCALMRIRVYIRDQNKGQFRGMGWICPACLDFKNDIEEAERKNAMFRDKIEIPQKNYVLELLTTTDDEYD